MRILTCFTCLFVVFVVGCTPQNAPPPNTAKVSGKVNLNGKAMSGGEARFHMPGQLPRAFPISNGEFSGEAFLGKNRVEVVLERDGLASTTDSKAPTKVNSVAPKDLQAEVTKEGANSFSFDVVSK